MPRVPLPRAITVYDSDAPADALLTVGGYRERWQPALVPKEFRIVRRWFRWSSVPLLVFALFWDAFLVNWYSLLPRHTIAVALVLFSSVHLGVGIWVTYTALTGLVNSTVVRAHGGILEVTHGPIPVRGSARLEIASIDQIYAERKVTDSKGYGGPTIAYNLCVRTKIGLEKVLIADLPEANQALYLQQALEARLGIESARSLAPTKGEASG